MAECDDPRLRRVMEVVVRKLHEAVLEIEPTEEEGFAAIQFLTNTGQACNDWRQEYILPNLAAAADY
jgi:hydroxyquinol 1,2-dioxygenase